MIEVEIETEGWILALPEAEALTLAAARAALAGAAPAGVAVLLGDDARIRALNARFRGKDQPTNVLAFPAPVNPEGHLGDVALALETCAREAEAQGKRLAHHLQHLVVHGVLHLRGYDHMNDADASAMEGLERTVLAGLGISDPYASGEGDHD